MKRRRGIDRLLVLCRSGSATYALEMYDGEGKRLRVTPGPWKVLREEIGSFQSIMIMRRLRPEHADAHGAPLPGHEPPGYDPVFHRPRTLEELGRVTR